MKTTGVSDIPKFGLLGFLGHPNDHWSAKLPPGAWSNVWGSRPIGGGGLFFSFLNILFFSFCFNHTYVSSSPSQPNTVFKGRYSRTAPSRPLPLWHRNHVLSGFLPFSRDEFTFILFTKSMASGSPTGDAGQTGRARGCLGLVPRTETWDHYS